MLSSPQYQFKNRDVVFTQILEDCLMILDETKGCITTFHKCDISNNLNPVSYPTFRHINTNDIFHLLIAKENGFSELDESNIKKIAEPLIKKINKYKSFINKFYHSEKGMAL